MRTLRSLLMLSFAIAVLAGAANRALAAESYDSCVGDINTVPTVITTGGTWCLRHNVITAAINTRALSAARVMGEETDGDRAGGYPQRHRLGSV